MVKKAREQTVNDYTFIFIIIVSLLVGIVFTLQRSINRLHRRISALEGAAVSILEMIIDASDRLVKFAEEAESQEKENKTAP